MIPLIAGAAANVGGNLLNAYGQSIGGKAAMRERLRQMEEQDAIQAEADVNAQNELTSYNPVLAQRASEDAINSPGQQAIAQVAAQRPHNSEAGGAADAQMVASDVGAGASQRAAMAAQATAPEVAGQNLNNRLARFSDMNSTLENKAGRLAKLYNMKVHNAGNKGATLRAAGGLISSAGQMGMGADGMMG